MGDAQAVGDSLARMPLQIEEGEIIDSLSKEFKLAAITNCDSEVVDTLIEVHGLPIEAAITFEEKGV